MMPPLRRYHFGHSNNLTNQRYKINDLKMYFLCCKIRTLFIAKICNAKIAFLSSERGTVFLIHNSSTGIKLLGFVSVC